MVQAGAGAGFNFGLQINPSTGDVFLTGGIGAGLGASASATYQFGASPSEGFAWKFNATAGNGLLAVQGTTKWDATHYQRTGKHSVSASGGPKTGGGGTGFGASVSGTFSGTIKIGNLGEFAKWLSDTFFGNKKKDCP